MKSIYRLLSVLIVLPSLAFATDLSGTRLGEVDYGISFKWGFLGPQPKDNHFATRIYLDKVPNEPGSYYGVYLEYFKMTGVGAVYAVNRKLPGLSPTVGYLNKITKKIIAFKAVPLNEYTYLMYPLKVTEGGNLEIIRESNPRRLILSRTHMSSADPLAGAMIKPGSHRLPNDKPEPEVFFPIKGKGSIEYRLASAAYNKAKLKSTWHKKFLQGPLLSAYLKKDDVVLDLSSAKGKDRASFRSAIRSGLTSSERANREAVFTHPRSAYVKGLFDVKMPIAGMFTLSTISGQKYRNPQDLTSRIGLFIDIFDAGESRGEYVVELAFINPYNPEDIMMYYDHPDNGELRKNNGWNY